MTFRASSSLNIGTISIAILFLIIARCVAQIFVLENDANFSAESINLYVIGALAATGSALVAVILQACRRPRAVAAVAAVTVVSLFIFKLVAGHEDRIRHATPTPENSVISVGRPV